MTVRVALIGVTLACASCQSVSPVHMVPTKEWSWAPAATSNEDAQVVITFDGPGIWKRQALILLERRASRALSPEDRVLTLDRPLCEERACGPHFSQTIRLTLDSIANDGLHVSAERRVGDHGAREAIDASFVVPYHRSGSVAIGTTRFTYKWKLRRTNGSSVISTERPGTSLTL